MAKEKHGQAPSCNGCMNWDRFGKKCWVYWDLKKQCSHYADGSVKAGAPEDAIRAAIPRQPDMRQAGSQDREDNQDKKDTEDNKF